MGDLGLYLCGVLGRGFGYREPREGTRRKPQYRLLFCGVYLDIENPERGRDGPRWFGCYSMVQDLDIENPERGREPSSFFFFSSSLKIWI